MKNKMKKQEADLQKACVQWFGMQYPHYKELLHHSPNGGYRNKKTRITKKGTITYSPEGAKFKAMGTKDGFPDLFLYVPNKKFHGFAIEMKYGKNDLSKNQMTMLSLLWKQGYNTEVINNKEEFIKVINDYLKDI